MNIKNFKEKLIEKLYSLSDINKSIYSMYCIERIYGLYLLYTKKFNINTIYANQIKQRLWESIFYSNKDLNNLNREIENILPKEDFQGWEVALAINMSICFDISFKSMNNEHKNEVSGLYVYDSIFQVCCFLSHQKFIDKYLLNRIENSVIIAEEVNYQIQYLQYLEDKKVSLEKLKFYKNYWENNTLSIQYIKDKW